MRAPGKIYLAAHARASQLIFGPFSTCQRLEGSLCRWYHFLTCDAVPFFFLSQIALASFYEDGGDEDIMTLPQPTSSSVTRGTAARPRSPSLHARVHREERRREQRKLHGLRGGKGPDSLH
uniref:Uncharacterized protein n=1 Tax=Pseudonaja textilis TaxID=8673 RepID=A0A670ZJZ2_PSETE